MTSLRPALAVIVLATLHLTTPLDAQTVDRTRSLMARTLEGTAPRSINALPHGLRDASLFAVTPPETRVIKKHDLIQIIVRETSSAKSKQELETSKGYDLDGSVSAWPDLRLDELLQLQVRGGSGTNLPRVGLRLDKDFEGDGDYSRQDDLSARLTAEVLDVLPNGHLILEARTKIRTDDEVSEIRLSGICRQDDISASNTIYSNLLHDLKIEKMHSGELRRSTQKGLVAKLLDALFAF